MKYICLDIEMTEAKGRKQKNELHGLRNEIIEIGAIMLDSNFNYMGCISIPVKPEHTSVTDFITELTGITNKSLAEADNLREAFKKYMAWVGKGDVTTFCWGQNDFSQLWDELYVKSGFEEKYFANLKNFMDLQSIFGNLIGTKLSFSLDAALKTVGCKFIGHRHSALGDAFNTARILFKLSKENGFDIEQGKLYGKAKTIYGRRYNRCNLNIEDSVSMGVFFPKDLLEKFNLKSAEQNEQIIEETTEAKKKINGLDICVKRFFPKSICAKYNVPVQKYFIFWARMFFRKDLKCKDGEIINS